MTRLCTLKTVSQYASRETTLCRCGINRQKSLTVCLSSGKLFVRLVIPNHFFSIAVILCLSLIHISPVQEVLAMARWCYEKQYGSITLQSGERQDEAFIACIETLVKEIKKIGGGALGITLSLGEQTPEKMCIRDSRYGP